MPPPAHEHQPTFARPALRRAAAVAALVFGVYAISAWDMLLEPSPHFHFVDMAQSWLDGRLDTDTPRRRGAEAGQPGDPPGYQEAINRHVGWPANKRGGWNDWASYRELTLRDGTVVRGVFPWKDQRDKRRLDFYTLDGALMTIDVARDLKRGCDPERPRARCDRVVYQVSFPPLPALLMLPAVAVIGYDLNDVLFTLLFPALSAMLLFLWLRRLRAEGLLPHDERGILWIVALFFFGTVSWYCGIRGAVWFTALTMGVTFHLAFLLAAQDARRPWLAGLLLGLGVATRVPLLFGAIFLPLEAFFPRGVWLGGRGAAGMRDALGKVVAFAVPAGLIGLGLAWFNDARWGSPTEFGHRYLLEGTRGPIREHGLFAWHFLNHNLSAALTNMPDLMPRKPFVGVTLHGIGIFACTPALLALVGGGARPELFADVEPEIRARRDALARHLFIAVLAIATPALFYQNDGWQQFGYRFALDFWPALIGVFALRVGRLSRGVKALIVLSMVVQLFGAVTFGRMPWFYHP